jgi:prevent-host-death family protein
MVRLVTVGEIEATFPQLLDHAEAGEEIEINRGGRPVARLVPVRATSGLKGSFEGLATTVAAESELMSVEEPWNVA